MKPDPHYVRRNGLLVPADTLTPEAVELRSTLAGQRHLANINREDRQARKAGRAHHRNKLADIAEKALAARRARRARARDTREQADLNRLYRVAVRSGTRARIRADIQRSAEMRALRVGKVRGIALIAGLPILAAFAAWSTAGAQAGAVRLLGLAEGSPGWWASWGVEPALIAIVALIITGRAVLKASGGQTDRRATLVEWAALLTSLGLNIFGGWENGWEGIKTVLPHAIGPTFCALTAVLIGLFVGYAADAKPWDDAPTLTEMGFVAPHDAPSPAVSVTSETVSGDPGEELAQIAQVSTGLAADPGPDMPADGGPDTPTGQSTGRTPDSETPSGPDGTPDNATGQATDIAADNRPDTTPDTVTDSPAGHTPDTRSDNASDTGTGQQADTRPDTQTDTKTRTDRTPRYTVRRAPDRTPKWTKEQLKAFRLRDTRTDMTYPLIAREVGVSEKTVSRWFKAREASETPDTGLDNSATVRPETRPEHPLVATPIPDPTPPVTAGVNGRTYNPQETQS